MLLRNVVLFPIFVALTVHFESRIEASALSAFKILLLLCAIHLLLRKVHARSTQQQTFEMAMGDLDEFPQRLGL